MFPLNGTLIKVSGFMKHVRQAMLVPHGGGGGADGGVLTIDNPTSTRDVRIGKAHVN
jgi:hypothetical protein